jgi:choline dehydrogenase
MVYDRGFASDYDRIAAAGNAGWSYAGVLPYFRRTETFHRRNDPFHGDSGPIQVSRPGVKHPFAQAFVAAGREAGFAYNDDTNGAVREGFGPVDVTIGRGVRSSASRAYLRPARRRPNLTVLTGAHACRVLLVNGRASGVEYLRKGRVEQARAEREVLLCGGAINSPQLLMLSGIGAGDALRRHGIAVQHELAGVGQGLQDHLAVVVKYRSLAPISLFKYFKPWHGAFALARYLVSRGGPLGDPGMEACAFVKSDPAVAEPDIKLLLVMALYANNGRELSPHHGFAAHTNVIRPESRGSVRLASANPLDAPLIDQNYLASEDDRRGARAAVGLAREVFAQKAFDTFRGEELEPGPGIRSSGEIDCFVRTKAEADYHSVGTCRMGQDEFAVVDAELRVRGLAGLRVVDASVIPHMIGGNTAMPVIMIAEKAADLIRGLPAPAP